MPPTPAINKWTQLAPVCDMLVFGAMIHNIFAKTFFGLDIPMAGEIDSTIDFDMIKDILLCSVGLKVPSKQGLPSTREHSPCIGDPLLGP